MKRTLIVVAAIALLLSSAGVASAATVSLQVTNLAACRDTTTVTVSGTSSYSTNRINVNLYKQDANGNYNLFRTVTTDAFGSGDFSFPVTVDYSTKTMDAGTALRIEVRLKAPGSSTVSGPITLYTVAGTQFCEGRCSVIIVTADKAPAKGVITLRSHFGSWFRPEGWLHGVIPVTAGQTVNSMIVGAPCDATMRAWYYPATGKDRTPRLLPSQYWPSEFGTAAADGSAAYTTTFKRGLPATKPLESDDRYASK